METFLQNQAACMDCYQYAGVAEPRRAPNAGRRGRIVVGFGGRALGAALGAELDAIYADAVAGH